MVISCKKMFCTHAEATKDGSGGCGVRKARVCIAEQISTVPHGVRMLNFSVGCQHVVEVLFSFPGLYALKIIIIYK